MTSAKTTLTNRSNSMTNFNADLVDFAEVTVTDLFATMTGKSQIIAAIRKEFTPEETPVVAAMVMVQATKETHALHSGVAMALVHGDLTTLTKTHRALKGWMASNN